MAGGSLTITDINNDGKRDIILGNIGEPLKSDSSHPAKLWMMIMTKMATG